MYQKRSNGLTLPKHFMHLSLTRMLETSLKQKECAVSMNRVRKIRLPNLKKKTAGDVSKILSKVFNIFVHTYKYI